MTRRYLTELPPGQAGFLASTPETGASARRLMELGFVPGTRIEVVRVGALGDPVEVELRGYRICLRRTELSGLEVVVREAAR